MKKKTKYQGCLNVFNRNSIKHSARFYMTRNNKTNNRRKSVASFFVHISKLRSTVLIFDDKTL